MFLVVLVALIAGLWLPAATLAKGNEATVDIIIQTQGSAKKLAKHIRSLGGTVNFQYKNVPAVAATVPADKLGQVASFKGVTKIEKDRPIYLADRSPEGKNAGNPMSFEVEDLAGVQVQAASAAAFQPESLPEGYANFLYTGAFDTWGDTNFGEGSIVAVVDTGTVRNTCIGPAVIGAPGFPDGYNATDDGIPATDPGNHWHGTHVGGVIASSCSLDFTLAPDHPIYLAQAKYLGWPVDSVPIFGQAPGAQLYPVKVFRADGGSSPSSVIMDGLDHLLTLKKEGLLDVDIVNMSLGGETVWDGRDTFDRFCEELQAANILVVTSASNSGPIPNSIGSPATSFGAVSVGALDYALSSATLYEYLGLAVWPGAPGMGDVMRPTTETRVVNYSSRGPLSDGRFGPEIVALGHWNFQAGTTPGSLRWAGGTSFSSPTVAGGAALLNAWWEAQGHETDPIILENVLLLGADPGVVAPPWQGINDQGYGTLDVTASLDRLMNGQWKLKPAKKSGELRATVLGKPVKNKVQTWESDTITLAPSVPFNAVLEIGQYTSRVTIEVFDIDIPDNWDYAFWANALEIHLGSAKRSSIARPFDTVYWYPWYGDSFTIEVEDGPWTFAGGLWDYLPMEPGLMKLGLIGDYSNESPISFKVRITRENNRQPLENRVANGNIKNGDTIFVPVEIPEGVTAATFDLTWHRDWSKFPTSDLDMLLYDPNGDLAWADELDEGTGNAPERAVIADPMPGTWTVVIEAFDVEMYKPDNYNLYVNFD
jgi:hypothetical protein